MNTQITLKPRATGSKVNAVITTHATGQMHDMVAVQIIEDTLEAVEAFASFNGFDVAGEFVSAVGNRSFELVAR